MRIKLPTLFYYPCPCCAGPLLARAKLRRGGLTTFLFCRRCGEKSDVVRRTWPAALWHGVRWSAMMTAALVGVWLFCVAFLSLAPDP